MESLVAGMINAQPADGLFNCLPMYPSIGGIGAIGAARTMELSVNGSTRRIGAPPDTPLLWVLREELELTGTKYGCGIGVCGVCIVHLDDDAVPSCILPVGQAEGAAVTTIEGLARDGALDRVQQAWLDQEVSQCGYCQPGMIMAAAALLRKNPHPTAGELATGINVVCRCGTYQRVMRAVLSLLSP
jgi:isoquinoline 1-oxidoreductase subunit alpha